MRVKFDVMLNASTADVLNLFLDAFSHFYKLVPSRVCQNLDI